MFEPAQAQVHTELKAALPQNLKKEPWICEHCKLIWIEGRYHWNEPVPAEAVSIKCPACQRIESNQPGAEIVLRGEFVESHLKELLSPIAETVAIEKTKNPLERQITLLQLDDRIEITTAFERLARRIGEQIQQAFWGELRSHYIAPNRLQMIWQRN